MQDSVCSNYIESVTGQWRKLAPPILSIMQLLQVLCHPTLENHPLYARGSYVHVCHSCMCCVSGCACMYMCCILACACGHVWVVCMPVHMLVIFKLHLQ